MKTGFFACIVLVSALLGCDSREPSIFDSEMVTWGSASPERRMAFAENVVKAMRDFDGLYGAQIKIDIVEISPGNPTVRVKGETDKKNADLERQVSVAVTNFSLKYPGIGFIKEEDGSWRVIIPDDMSVPVSGDFKLKFS